MKSSDKRRTFAWLRDRYRSRCAYCECPLTHREDTIDHFMPKALGGTNDRENLRLACNPCNEEKADMHPDDWLRLIADRPKSTRRPTASEERIAILARIAQAAREKARGA